jgi:HEPN domain-containing protein
MKTSTRDWVKKAEEDFLAAGSLARRRSKPLWNIVCFHAWQTIEKYLKARMEEAGMSVPKTHDLLHLLNLLAKVEPLWSA